MLQSGATGAPIATLDGTRLTVWRTAAASALAARYLARADAKSLLIVGAGALAPFLARAHASQRPIERIAVWNHRPEGARRLAASARRRRLRRARASSDLQDGVRDADIISCATLSQAPLIAGAWLKAGQHLDLVGAFIDADARGRRRGAEARARLRRHRRGAERGRRRRARPCRAAPSTRADVVADLAALVRGAPGRGGAQEITLFKSVGAAIEDLAAAMLVWRKAGGGKF